MPQTWGFLREVPDELEAGLTFEYGSQYSTNGQPWLSPPRPRRWVEGLQPDALASRFISLGKAPLRLVWPANNESGAQHPDLCRRYGFARFGSARATSSG